MDLELKNKIATVGGASKGLGFVVARALTAEGGAAPAMTPAFDDCAWQPAFDQPLSRVQTVRLVIPSRHARGGTRP